MQKPLSLYRWKKQHEAVQTHKVIKSDNKTSTKHQLKLSIKSCQLSETMATDNLRSVKMWGDEIGRRTPLSRGRGVRETANIICLTASCRFESYPYSGFSVNRQKTVKSLERYLGIWAPIQLKKTVKCFKFWAKQKAKVLWHCEVMKLADMPSCLGGREFGINEE